MCFWAAWRECAWLCCTAHVGVAAVPLRGLADVLLSDVHVRMSHCVVVDRRNVDSDASTLLLLLLPPPVLFGSAFISIFFFEEVTDVDTFPSRIGFYTRYIVLYPSLAGRPRARGRDALGC